MVSVQDTISDLAPVPGTRLRLCPRLLDSSALFSAVFLSVPCASAVKISCRMPLWFKTDLRDLFLDFTGLIRQAFVSTASPLIIRGSGSTGDTAKHGQEPL